MLDAVQKRRFGRETIVARLFSDSTSSGRLALAAFLLALLAFLPGQHALPVTDRDEARFAQASRQMLESGDFVDIRFQESARHNKPALAYWAQAAAASVAGGADAPIGAYRAPSWLAAAGAVALTVWAGSALVGRQAALLAGAGLAATILLAAEARLAKTDALLLMTCVAALGALARIHLGRGDPRRWAALLWLAVGAGLMIKGPIILIPVAGGLAGAAIAARSWAPLRRVRPLWGLPLALAVAAPWLIAITLISDGGFWSDSVGRDLLAKAVAGQESHGAPPGYHTLVALVAFWPWAVLLPVAAPAVWRARAEPATALLIGWAAATWIVFELTPTKLPHYVLPAYPALALLLAAAALRGLPDPGPRARAVMVSLWAVPAAALAGAATLGPLILTGAPSTGGLILGAAAAVAAVAAARALAGWRLAAFAPAAGGAALLGAAAVLQFALPALTMAFPAPAMAEATARWRCGDARPVALTTYREPSAVFHLGTATLLTDGGGAAAAVSEGRAGLAWIGAREAAAFLAVHPEATARAAVSGFNYSNGRQVALTLYDGREDAPCDG
ncbi:ArnT family glycosyltransferase [Rubrimonas cliftonensis]|uniref:4-amino-4-deoxy-L-arabinose transferase n=1 Tax=Rubrimonas cliftonensis TaxID=89524 RepID=A0A1H4DZE7_9RHOB|nr:glycosyltransferase family 39 protein [Rubrimonas cliftonensis]SEA78153.1 4-amino-4-deoxy-L-arabinose transferase [Rubrimonas cliftonensis]